MSRQESDTHFFWIDKNYLDKIVNDYANGQPILRFILLVHLFFMRRMDKYGNTKAWIKDSDKIIGVKTPYWEQAIEHLTRTKQISASTTEMTVKKNGESVQRRIPIVHLFDDNGSGEKRNNYKSDPIFIASKVVDEQCLKTMSLEEIITLLLMYENLNLRSYYGIDWHFLSYFADTIPAPNNNLEVLPPDVSKIEKFQLDKLAMEFFDNIMSLKAKGILEWVPVILEAPSYDPMMVEVKSEIMAVDRKRICQTLTEGQSIRWILRPVNKYLPKTDMYEEFKNRRGISEQEDLDNAS